MKSPKNLLGIFFLLLSAFLYGIMPIMIRLLKVGGLPPMAQVFSRYIFAFISALIYFIVTKSKFKIEKKDILLLLLTTIFGYALTNLFFTYGIIYTTVGNALFLFYIYGIITPIFSFFLLKERFNKFNLISLVLSLIALFFLFQPNSISTWKLGGFFAILSALCQSLYLISRRKLLKYSAATMMIMNTVVGIIVLGILSFIFEGNFYSEVIQTVSSKTWITTIIFGVDNFLAWLFMTKGFELFKASTGSIVLLIENVFAIILAAIFLKEIPTYLTIIGGSLILLSSIVVISKSEQ
jgi:drug/metabolite transporter (DMT)-like permease